MTGTAGTTERSRADRILIARICGKAKHHAKWRELSSAEEASAAAGLLVAPAALRQPGGQRAGTAPGLPGTADTRGASGGKGCYAGFPALSPAVAQKSSINSAS